jgi:hypothetical protein
VSLACGTFQPCNPGSLAAACVDPLVIAPPSSPHRPIVPMEFPRTPLVAFKVARAGLGPLVAHAPPAPAPNSSGRAWSCPRAPSNVGGGSVWPLPFMLLKKKPLTGRGR